MGTEKQKKGPIFILMVYSLSMIILPLLTFFTSRTIIQHYYKIDANLYSAVLSVAVVHCILLAFVYTAFKEDKAYAEKKIVEKID